MSLLYVTQTCGGYDVLEKKLNSLEPLQEHIFIFIFFLLVFITRKVVLPSDFLYTFLISFKFIVLNLKKFLYQISRVFRSYFTQCNRQKWTSKIS